MPKNNFFNRDVMFADANGNFLPFDDSTEFFNKWNEYSITIETEKGPITIKWNDVQSLAANWFMQTGSWMKNPNLQTFFDFFPVFFICNFDFNKKSTHR